MSFLKAHLTLNFFDKNNNDILDKAHTTVKRVTKAGIATFNASHRMSAYALMVVGARRATTATTVQVSVQVRVRVAAPGTVCTGTEQVLVLVQVGSSTLLFTC